MTHNNHKHRVQEQIVKFHVPRDLKTSIQELAHERNISLSALMRLIATEYLKRNKFT